MPSEIYFLFGLLFLAVIFVIAVIASGSETPQTGNSESDNSGSNKASRQDGSTLSQQFKDSHPNIGHRFAKYPAIGLVVGWLRAAGWSDLIGSVCLANPVALIVRTT
jgi:predicted heme/steroid binding protein